MKKLLLLLGLLAGPALSQSLPPITLPTIYFDAPAGFSGGGSDVATFTAPEGDLAIHVYPFRRLGPGDFQARFRETLLREFVAPGLREQKPATTPQIHAANVEGAEAALTGRFNDGKSERVRLALLSAGAVAIIEVSAASPAAIEKHNGALKQLTDSLSVGQPKARAAPPPVIASPEIAAVPPASAASTQAPAAASAAPQAAPAAPPPPPFGPGLYVGNVRRLIPSFVGGVQSGGMWVSGPQYFLFSSEGQAYRSYDQPRMPFDWARAQRADAANTGSYELLGTQLTLRLGTETINARIAGPGRFDIFNDQFKRTTPK